jgi:hypothetical protein
MSDTPRTDAVVAPYIGSDSVTVEECSALLDEARQLERELAAANARIRRLEEAGDELEACSRQLGWTSVEDPIWIRRAEAAVTEWTKTKGAQ